MATTIVSIMLHFDFAVNTLSQILPKQLSDKRRYV